MSKSGTESSKAKDEATDQCLEALAALRRGGLVVFPTETLYGLGADALNAAAVDKVLDVKGRDAAKPISVIVADRAMLESIVTDIPGAGERLIERFWPGPLTLILPARNDLPAPLVNASGGIAVRVSSHPLSKRLVEELKRPLTATSANPAGKDPARTVQEARNYFGERVEVYLEGGTLLSKSGSTIAELAADRVRLLREGEITSAELEAALGTGKLSR